MLIFADQFNISLGGLVEELRVMVAEFCEGEREGEGGQFIGGPGISCLDRPGQEVQTEQCSVKV